MREEGKIYLAEPVIFIAFGLLHITRIWAFTNRRAYSAFWQNLLLRQGPLFYVLYAVLGVLALTGLVIWFRGLGSYTPWWRWALCATGLFAVFEIAALLLHFWWWEALLLILFDVTSPLYPFVWGLLVGLGVAGVLLGLYLVRRWRRQRAWGW